MVTTGPAEREFRKINRRTEIGAGWSDEGIESNEAPGQGAAQQNEAGMLRADAVLRQNKLLPNCYRCVRNHGY